MSTAGGLPRGPVLVLEAALSPPGAALVLDGTVREIELLEGGRGERSDLLRASCAVLARAGLSPASLAGLAIGTGPGSYTGVRVALGLAGGLAAAGALPIASADSPRLVAEAAGLVPPVHVAIPWGRLRVMIAVAREGGARREEATLVFRDDLAALGELQQRVVAVPAGANDLVWPQGTRPVHASCSAVEALAGLVAAGRLLFAADLPGPSYLLPPDAILPPGPPRGSTAPAIVRLGPEDLDGLAVIEQECFAEPWSRGMLADELRPREGRLALGVRRDDGGLDAAALARLEVETLAIHSVAVRPAARRRGLGRALVRALLACAREQGAVRADLEVRAGNGAAIALYASEGFVPVGRRRRYYGNGEDAVLMSLVLRREDGRSLPPETGGC